jgi:hypothetical protein
MLLPPDNFFQQLILQGGIFLLPSYLPQTVIEVCGADDKDKRQR